MSTSLNPALTFSTFVVGVPNQLAFSAARAAADSPRPPFNPLFLVATPGQGKTHLLQATGAQRLLVDSAATVEYVNWEAFLAKLGHLTKEQAVTEFHRVDLLLLDDLGGFRHGEVVVRDSVIAVLASRLDAGHQTVCAGTIPPAELPGGEESINHLLGGGLVAEIGPPDEALREEIIRRRASFAGVSFSSPVIDAVVGLPCDSVRELLGAVSRLIAFQEVSPVPLDPAQTRVLVTGVVESDPMAPPSQMVVASGEAVARSPLLTAPLGGDDSGDEDEFGSFLSEVVAGVSQQVDRWRARVADAILAWEAEGIHTARLHALLDQELPAQPEAVLERFEEDVNRLQTLAAEIASLAPDLADHESLRDPDQLMLAERLLDEARTQGLREFTPNASLLLSDLIEVTSNRAALTALRETLDRRDRSMNPILLVGDSGTGKTHILHGIANQLSTERAVVCLSAGSFCSAIAEAEREDRTREWTRRFAWAGGLCLDDMHLMAEHPVAQGALVGVLDELLEANVPIVFASLIPVTALAEFSPQLLTRVAGGLVIDLPRPDREFRLALVLRLLETAPMPVTDPGLADYLAGIEAASIREVQGTVKRVLRASHREGGVPTVAMAKQVVESGHGFGGHPRSVVHAGVLGPTVGGTRLREKMIDSWPDIRDLVTETLD